MLASIREQTVKIQSDADLQKLKDQGATIVTGRHKLRLPRHVMRLRQQLERHAEELKEADAELAEMRQRHIPVGTHISRGDYLFDGLNDHANEGNQVTSSKPQANTFHAELDDIVAQVLLDHPDEGAQANVSPRSLAMVSESQKNRQQKQQQVREQLSSTHVKDVLSQAAASS
eukprot:gene25799-32269_t